MTNTDLLVDAIALFVGVGAGYIWGYARGFADGRFVGEIRARVEALRQRRGR